MIAILGGLTLVAGMVCGITLGALGAPGLAVATAVGITLGAILLGTSLALLPESTKTNVRKRIQGTFEKSRSYNFLSSGLADALKTNFKESTSLPKDMQSPAIEDVNVFTAKNNSKVRLVTFKIPSLFSPILDNGKGVSRACFIPPEANLTKPSTVNNSSLEMFKLELGDHNWNTNLAEFSQKTKQPAGWSRTAWNSSVTPSSEESPQYLINIWNPFGHYPKTPNEQPGDRRHPLYGKRSLEDQKEMFVGLFKSLMTEGIHSIGIYGHDLLFPKGNNNDFYIDMFAQFDGDFDSRVGEALSLALTEIAQNKDSKFSVCFYGMGGNPLRKPKPMDFGQTYIDDTIDDEDFPDIF
nr:hypothetical protein [Chlamydia felis]